MSAYVISKRNSFQINGQTFIVARTRYRDDGMSVFQVVDGVAHRFPAFWTCLLTPEINPRRSCRAQAEAGIRAWIQCKGWAPSKEQLREIGGARDKFIPGVTPRFRGFIHSAAEYIYWFRCFHPNHANTQEITDIKTQGAPTAC